MNLGIKRKTIIIAAPVSRRIIAFLIDMLIVSFILWPFGRVLNKLSNFYNVPLGFNMYTSIMPDGFISKFLLISIFMAIITVIYFTILESKFNQSLGKNIMRIIVVKDEKNLRLNHYH